MLNYLNAPGPWKPGIYDLESYAQYDSIPALRSSELKQMKKSAAHYKAAHEYPRIITPQLQRIFDKGKAFDILILHGAEELEKAVAIEPEIGRGTKEYKTWFSSQKNKLVLAKQEYDFVYLMREKSFTKQRFSEIFGGEGFAHKVLVWQDADSGIWCKAEIDWICADGTVVDLKSTSSADFFFFRRNAWRLGYQNQGAHYLDGLTQITGNEHNRFMLAAVEVDPPFESNIFRVNYDSIMRAMDENRELMARLAHCFETDSWPGYPDVILDLESGQFIEENLEEMEEEADGF